VSDAEQLQRVLASAVALRRENRGAEAETALRSVLRHLPAHAPALHLLGVLALERNAASEALAHFDAALFGAPKLAALHYNRGNALSALGRMGDAAKAYGEALALEPTLGEAHFNRGNAARAMGRFDAAERDWLEAARLRPTLVEAPLRLGALYADQQRWDQSEASYARVLELDPGNAAAWNRRGIALHQQRRIAEAQACYERALALDGERAEVWNNLGNAMHDLRRTDAARDCYLRAIAIDPAAAEPVDNLGMLAQEAGDLGRARDNYTRAMALAPQLAEPVRRMASLDLLEGRLAEGWAHYERSQAIALRGTPPPSIPWWQGEDLRGKSILLSEPNGIGDTLQFFRFVPRLLDAGVRVSFLGPPAVFPLLSGFADRVRFVTDATDGKHDVQALLWSLPHYLGIHDEQALRMDAPYLHADATRTARWAHLVEPGALNVGISWQGNPDRKIDAGRSIPLAAFAPLARVPGVRLVSLQRGHGVEQLAALPDGMQVVDPGAGFDAGPEAFADTAALLPSLDLVVSADTALVHVAGGLGHPAWLVLNRAPDWRWQLGREDSPWYPSVRIFRQQRLDDWDGVLAQVAQAAAALRAQRFAVP
jgi:tetratricopeptide (TPR) repeat protein